MDTLDQALTEELLRSYGAALYHDLLEAASTFDCPSSTRTPPSGRPVRPPAAPWWWT